MTAPAPQPAEDLRGFLADVRARIMRRAGARAAVWTATLVIAAAMAAPLFALTTTSGRPILWLAVAVVAAILVAGIACGIVLPGRRWKNDDDVAREVGAHAPAIASDLLSSVQLAVDGAPPAGAGSPALIAALVADTATRVRSLSPRTAVPGKSAHGLVAALLVTVAVAAGITLAAPGAVARGYARMWIAPPPSPFDGASVTPAPIVADIVITLTPPAYTGLPPRVVRSSTGDFSAMPGTRADITATALSPATTAQIIFGKSAPHQKLTMDVTGRELSARITVDKAAVYRFLVEDQDGERRVEGHTHTIAIDPDEKPKIQLFAPARDLDVHGRKRIELAYIAEDDHGLDKIELVWSQEGEEKRKPVRLGETGVKTAQAKFLWDLQEVSIAAGQAVAYHLEATDTDTVSGPKIGVSETFYLRILSARDRHERVIDRQRRGFETMVRLLGSRLVVAGSDIGGHETLNRETRSLAAELGGIVADMASDPLAPKKLATLLGEMGQRLDALAGDEHEILTDAEVRARKDKEPSPRIRRRLERSDHAHTEELEDDVIVLIDWIDRQEMELLLAISDDIQTHRKHVAELFAQYERTHSPEILAEIQRELATIEHKLGELSEHQSSMPADVLDRFVNVEALVDDKQENCLAEVKELIAAGQVAAAKKKMAECEKAIAGTASALETALGDLRGEAFPREQRAFGEVMNELADLGESQREIAAETDDIWKRYADRAREAMRDQAGATRDAVSGLVDELEAEIKAVPADGLTPFSRDELAVAASRVKDVRAMLAEGDIAEALAMARHAETSLETVAGDLMAAGERGAGPWQSRTVRAQEAVSAAQATAAELVRQLAQSTPTPEEIMSPEDRARLGKLASRQRSVQKRAERLAHKAKNLAGDLPGQVGSQLAEKLAATGDTMRRAGQRMQKRDPAGARARAREAADALAEAASSARDAARRRLSPGRSERGDETVRIPGADEYKPPATLREDLLKAMNKEHAPDGYGDVVKRYYEELIK